MRGNIIAIMALMLANLLALGLFAPVLGAENKPTIYVTPPPSRNFPLKIYVYQSSCPDHERLVVLFYDSLRDLRKAIIRFSVEYPEYSRLLEIGFRNVSTAESADITFMPADYLDGFVAYTNFTGAWTPYKSGIYVVCDILRRGSEEWARGVIMHELLHALGLGHAWQDQTDDGKPEVMRYVPADTRERVYPSTLDLYGLYVSYFDFHFKEVYNNVTLPDGMPYVMVVPYDVEIKRLREANERLRSEIDDLWRWLRHANEVIEEFEEANRGLGRLAENLTRENAELKAINQALMEQLAETWAELQLTKQVLDHYRGENERLRQNLSEAVRMSLMLAEYCNQTILDLIRENEMLRSNLTAAIEYAKAYESAYNFVKITVITLGTVALILILLFYRSLRRALNMTQGNSRGIDGMRVPQQAQANSRAKNSLD